MIQRKWSTVDTTGSIEEKVLKNLKMYFSPLESKGYYVGMNCGNVRH